jgi:hypothetical protein
MERKAIIWSDTGWMPVISPYTRKMVGKIRSNGAVSFMIEIDQWVGDQFQGGKAGSQEEEEPEEPFKLASPRSGFAGR